MNRGGKIIHNYSVIADHASRQQLSEIGHYLRADYFIPWQDYHSYLNFPVLNFRQPEESCCTRGVLMKRLLPGLFSVPLIIVGAAADRASAADMPLLKAPPPVVSNWTGLYGGIELGAKFETDKMTTTCVQDAPLFTCGSPLNAIVFPGAPDGSSPHSFSTSGFRPGFYLGFNEQVGNSNWIYGAEVDWAFYNRSASVTGLVGCSTAACTGFAPGAPFLDRTSVQDLWDTSLRGRIGYLVTPNVLAYGTAGLAFQAVNATMSCFAPTSPACLISHSQTNSATSLPGFTVGGGLEWMVWQNIILRGEYRFAEYATWNTNFFLNSPDINFFQKLRVTDQIATFGIAYKLPSAGLF